jgi:hypothetical protein
MSTTNAKSVLRLTDTGNREANGLRILGLDLYDPSGRIVESWLVNSGQPYNQELLTDSDRKSGSYGPIPELVYNIGQLEFSGGRFDWATSWGPGLGNFWAAINPVRPKGSKGTTAALGFHWDENRADAPGSAGCVVFSTKQAVEDFVEAMRKYDPPQMVVDWGLGTVPKAPLNTFNGAKPAAKPTSPVAKPEQAIFVAPYANDNGFVVDFASDLKAGQYRVYTGANGAIKLIKK